MTRVAWVDCSVGAAGDMLLGALVDAGASAEAMSRAVASLGLPVTLEFSEQHVEPFRAMQACVETHDQRPPRRTWRDVRALLDAADLDAPVHAIAADAFRRLALAEARVHGVDPEDVHFHEVGAHDALGDIAGAAAGFVALGVDEVHVSAVALGGGWTRSEHGRLPVPAPAVLEILREAGAPSYGGPVPVELCTPTGAALLAAVASYWGPMPVMQVDAVGVGAGTRRLEDRPNLVRLVVGRAWEPGSVGAAVPESATGALLLETNVDDLDPRLWPPVLAQLLAAGASDAWLTPILMKKGRPAHTLSVLVPPDRADGVRRVVFRETTTLGLREQVLGKHELDRKMCTVDVDGEPVAVKIGLLDGVVVNAQPEYEDVAAAAARLSRPIKAVLAAAVAAVHETHPVG